MTMKQPIQPLYIDEDGRHRFHPNAIVRYLLDKGGIDLNQIAQQVFSREDREQFAQLIGYSLSGFAELSYVSDDTYGAAVLKSQGKTTEEAKIEHLEAELKALRESLAEPMARLFGKHPEDFR